MTAPRQPRHRLADDFDVPAPAPSAPVESLTQVLPIIPSQRAAVPQVYPSYPPATGEPAGPGSDGAVPVATPFVVPWPVASQRPATARRTRLPVVLAGVTALVLVLGVGVVVVESGPRTDAAPIAGR